MTLVLSCAHQFRVTKYNPAHRNELGHYTRNDWTSFSQVGSIAGDALLTLEDYERVERAYIQSAQAFLQEADVHTLTARSVENHLSATNAPQEGAELKKDALTKALQLVLRDKFWCRFESPSAFVHFGWDYYMYVGVPQPCESAQALARASGLFVEPFPSPYLEASR